MAGSMVAGAGTTATGGRKANEDSLLAAAPVFVVADGMGGHLAGADSSRAVVDAFHALAGVPSVTVEDVVGAVERAREGVSAVMTAHGGQSGSTLTGAVQVTVDGAPWWLVLNVGDSRVYSYAEGRLAQVTVDHSRVQELVDAGHLTAEEAELHPERNVITRAIGDGIPGQDLWLVPLSPRRRLVVVSDGLTKALAHAQIEALLAAGGSPAEASHRLVESAVTAGARDNVTVVVAESASLVTPEGASSGGLRVWTESIPGGSLDLGDDDDATQISARRGAVAPVEDDDATRVSQRRAGAPADDDATQISARRSAAAEASTVPALPEDDTHISVRRKPVTPAPGADPVPASADTPAHAARQRFGERRHAVRVREAPPIVVATMPAPVAPAGRYEVVEPEARTRREQRARLRTRAGLIGAGVGVGIVTVSAAVAGVWMLVTL